MIRINEETDAINLFESKLCGINFSDDGTYLTIIIDWIDGNGEEDSEKITFLGKYCSNVQFFIRTLDCYLHCLSSGLLITGFSYKKLEHSYLVQFDFDLEVEGYFRFECDEFSIETVGEPLQPGGNDNLIEDF